MLFQLCEPFLEENDFFAFELLQPLIASAGEFLDEIMADIFQRILFGLIGGRSKLS